LPTRSNTTVDCGTPLFRWCVSALTRPSINTSPSSAGNAGRAERRSQPISMADDVFREGLVAVYQRRLPGQPHVRGPDQGQVEYRHSQGDVRATRLTKQASVSGFKKHCSTWLLRILRKCIEGVICAPPARCCPQGPLRAYLAPAKNPRMDFERPLPRENCAELARNAKNPSSVVNCSWSPRANRAPAAPLPARKWAATCPVKMGSSEGRGWEKYEKSPCRFPSCRSRAKIVDGGKIARYFT